MGKPDLDKNNIKVAHCLQPMICNSMESEKASTAHPFCFNCGYNLRGLELPRACPECGRIADPIEDVSRTRSWFAYRSAAFGWILRPGKTPAGSWYALFDQASRKIARRREWLWLWLPAVLAAVIVAIGSFVVVDYKVKVWHYKQGDPQRTPLRIIFENETDRLYGFNLHPFRGGLFFNKPASWVEVVERQQQHVSFSVPSPFEPFFLLWGGVPLIAVMCGYYPAKWLVALRLRFRAETRGRPELRQSARAAWSLMAAPLSIALWLWLVASVLFGICELVERGIDDYGFIFYLLLLSVGLWVLVLLVGYARILQQDRARLIVENRLVGYMALIVVSIGGPVLMFWGLAQVFF